MALVEKLAFQNTTESFFKIRYAKYLEPSMVFFSRNRKISGWFDERICSRCVDGNEWRVSCAWICLFLRNGHIVEFPAAVNAAVLCRDTKGYFLDLFDDVFMDLRYTFHYILVILFAIFVTFKLCVDVEGYVFSNRAVFLFGLDKHQCLEMTDHEIDGSGDDRHKRKQADSKHEGDKGKNSKFEGGERSAAPGASGSGSSGDDGGDDGEDRERKEAKRGPQSAMDEDMVEEEEKENVGDLDNDAELDITKTFKTFVPPSDPPRDLAQEQRMQRRREAAQITIAERYAAEGDAILAEIAAEGHGEADDAAETGDAGEATSRVSRDEPRTNEDPEEVERMTESPEIPSDGAPSQTPSPPPGVTDAP